MIKRTGMQSAVTQQAGKTRRAGDERADEKTPTKPAANTAQPPKPVKKQDIVDIERADSEGMAPPQALPANS